MRKGACKSDCKSGCERTGKGMDTGSEAHARGPCWCWLVRVLPTALSTSLATRPLKQGRRVSIAGGSLLAPSIAVREEEQAPSFEERTSRSEERAAPDCGVLAFSRGSGLGLEGALHLPMTHEPRVPPVSGTGQP